ncbi:MAG: RNA methyltransferase [Endozoicomonadaceae bacterium]|nr:RNA methyltransferase [Endozoicomonadaceae bacterium]
MSLDNVKIVLVNTTHPGNIGSAARAMKTMGLSRLVLVNPKAFPSPEAVTLASGATDVLDNAVVCSTLENAVADCGLIIGASARVRGVSLPLMEPSECAEAVVAESAGGDVNVAWVFGREDRGLTNDELKLCHGQAHIPSNPEFSSLNLASAVQLFSYELRKAYLQRQQAALVPERRTRDLANSKEMEYFYGHLQKVLGEIDFFKHRNPDKIMAKLRRLYGRVRPDRVELNILRGILSETQAALGRQPSGGRKQTSTV